MKRDERLEWREIKIELVPWKIKKGSLENTVQKTKIVEGKVYRHESKY